MRSVLYLIVVASLLATLDAAVVERVKRQFGFNPFGPTGPPPFDGTGLVAGNFVGFGPPRNNFRPPARNNGLTIPANSGNIVPRQVQQPNRNSSSFRQCLANCPTTNEYNPVCGSDSQNYFNQQRLQCANRCGMSVQMVRRGTCNN